MEKLLSSNGSAIALGRKLGSGGEGAVFELVGSSDLVCKLYHKAPDPQLQQKLRAMLAAKNGNATSFAAWPIDAVRSASSGALVGFVMPRVANHEPVHKLYSPRDRKSTFPQADFAFLLVSSRNIAAAIDEVHRSGHVVGDINENSVLVNGGAYAKLIDCDSFQVAVNGHIFPCKVGVPLYTPPELLGKEFEAVIRTTNHDYFGLAVLIFHL
jgi:DNA-binding helix-hairpin-helix protein with protein kinase domain